MNVFTSAQIAARAPGETYGEAESEATVRHVVEMRSIAETDRLALVEASADEETCACKPGLPRDARAHAKGCQG